jgi:hypothetical protein
MEAPMVSIGERVGISKEYARAIQALTGEQLAALQSLILHGDFEELPYPPDDKCKMKDEEANTRVGLAYMLEDVWGE